MQDETWLNIYSLIQVYQVFVKLEDIYLFTVELQNHLEGKYFKSLTGKLSTLQTSGNFTCYFQLHPQLLCIVYLQGLFQKKDFIISKLPILSVGRKFYLLAEKSFYFYMINLIYILFYTHHILKQIRFPLNVQVVCFPCPCQNQIFYEQYHFTEHVSGLSGLILSSY